jgi:hypothetical protein
MRYFKRYWDESRGDAHDAWGGSWWYFEADGGGAVSRQVEVYDRGPTLRYAWGRPGDEFGGLSDQPLDLAEFAGFEIPRPEFERVWGEGE